MAFKKPPPPPTVPDSPEKIILDLPRRKIPGALLHQGEVLREYATKGTKASDVAIQLPTGAGKTFVALMIGEWRRRKFHERVVYLSPTNQLVNQVVEQAEEKYGLTINAYTGSKADYTQAAKAQYKDADRIAVTTYSSLFNTNPFFANPDIIIVDDAHASENYIADLWTLHIERDKPGQEALHTAVAGVLRPRIDASVFVRLIGEDDGSFDRGWVDKLATPAFAELRDELRSVIDTYVADLDLRHPWKMLRDHLHACHLYLSSKAILIRPLIPPTWTHPPFAKATQRIFMSATLGGGGDLERLTGQRRILRLPVPDGWDRQGIGRRYFIFPTMSLDEDDGKILRQQLIRRAGRTLILVPSKQQAKQIHKDVAELPEFKVFSADAIEKSKKPFTKANQAVAIIAGRYDGIDFPGDDCRMLFVEGLPKATNNQERFLMSRMGANILFNERIQARVLQAIGRCTRSMEDFSVVLIVGEDYFTDRRRRAFLHPELQAEIEFGIEQSKDVSIAELLDNVDIFLQNGTQWEQANQQILARRATCSQLPMPAMANLDKVVSDEIEYQARLWQGDYETALDHAESVLGQLNDSELRGYRALWHYLAGSVAWLGADAREARLLAKARAHFAAAKEAAPGIPWLVVLSRFQTEKDASPEIDARALRQIERVEQLLAKLGTSHDRAFSRREREILEGLGRKETFEQAHVQLGELLGFNAGKVEADASPDPWWIADDLCFVFEDHAGATSESALDAKKARQASTHPAWIRANVKSASAARMLPVLVTPVTKATEGAAPHLEGVALWPLEEFRKWARDAVASVREIRRTFVEPGDLAWRTMALESFKLKGMDASSLYEKLAKNSAATLLTVLRKAE